MKRLVVIVALLCWWSAAFSQEAYLAKEIEELVSPYAGLKTLIIERDSKCPMPEFRAALKSIL